MSSFRLWSISLVMSSSPPAVFLFSFFMSWSSSDTVKGSESMFCMKYCLTGWAGLAKHPLDMFYPSFFLFFVWARYYTFSIPDRDVSVAAFVTEPCSDVVDCPLVALICCALCFGSKRINILFCTRLYLIVGLLIQLFGSLSCFSSTFRLDDFELRLFSAMNIIPDVIRHLWFVLLLFVSSCLCCTFNYCIFCMLSSFFQCLRFKELQSTEPITHFS